HRRRRPGGGRPGLGSGQARRLVRGRAAGSGGLGPLPGRLPRGGRPGAGRGGPVAKARPARPGDDRAAGGDGTEPGPPGGPGTRRGRAVVARVVRAHRRGVTAAGAVGSRPGTTTARMVQMRCPKWRVNVRTYERNGIHIEQCDNCRWIFLDYGELETLTQMESAYYAAPPR